MVQADVWLANQTLVPTANFGINTSEAADAIFNATTLPGASAADITQAKNLYAMLTGRITDADRRRAHQRRAATPTTCSARRAPKAGCASSTSSCRTRGALRPSLTVSAGLRYVLQNPFYPTNDSYTTRDAASLYGVSGDGNIFKPGTLTGARPQFVRYPKGQYAYNAGSGTTGRRASAPRGRCRPRTGFMKWLRGIEEGDVVVRGGWAMAYQRPGMSDFTGVFGANQGIAASLQTDQNNTRRCRSCCATIRTLPGAAGGHAAGVPVGGDQHAATPTIRTSSCPTRSRGRWAGSARSRAIRRSRCATSAASTRTTGTRSTSTSRTSTATASSTSSARPRPTCRPTSPPAAARRSPTWAPAPARPAADLPGALQRAERRQRRQRRRSTPAPTGPARRSSASSPRAIRIRGALRRTGHQRLGRQHHAAQQRGHGRLAGELLRRQSRSAGRREPDAPTPAPGPARTRCSSNSASASRTASRQHQLHVQPGGAAAALFGFTKPLEWIDQAGQVGNVRHALKANWTLEIPVGKDRKFGADMNGVPRRDRRRLVGGRRRPHPDR